MVLFLRCWRNNKNPDAWPRDKLDWSVDVANIRKSLRLTAAQQHMFLFRPHQTAARVGGTMQKEARIYIQTRVYTYIANKGKVGENNKELASC